MLIKSSISIIATLSIFTLIGCGGGGGSDSSQNGQNSDTATKSVTVERGALYHAKVTDANGQEAKDNGTNVYTFDNDIVYPVTAIAKSDGTTFVDVDGDGQVSRGDVNLSITLKSCSSNVTPITTLVANATSNCDKGQLHDKYTSLASDLNVSLNDLKALPSHVSNKHAIIVQNAAFIELHKGNHNANHQALKQEVEAIKGYTNGLNTHHQIESSVLTHNDCQTYDVNQSVHHPSHPSSGHKNRMIDADGTVHYDGDGHTNHMMDTDGTVHHDQDGHTNHMQDKNGVVHHDEDGHGHHTQSEDGSVHHDEDGHNNHSSGHH